ncbi:MAG: hypothetical protein IRY92_06700 [Dactylosporangium sp.]|nr:hypothetical protein [Dactylosporangium sp.]
MPKTTERHVRALVLRKHELSERLEATARRRAEVTEAIGAAVAAGREDAELEQLREERRRLNELFDDLQAASFAIREQIRAAVRPI